jgi:hypothetical protein
MIASKSVFQPQVTRFDLDANRVLDERQLAWS